MGSFVRLLQFFMYFWYCEDGEISVYGTCIDAYMKQKHRLIWQRRNPDKDMVGIDAKLKEMRKEIGEYQKTVTGNIVRWISTWIFFFIIYIINVNLTKMQQREYTKRESNNDFFL